MSSLRGQSVIVTGSSSGIGQSVAVLFAKKGANVTLCGRDTSRLQDAVKKCQQAAASAGYSNKFIEVAGDVTNALVRQNIIKKTVDAFGRIDHVVANHGAIYNGDSHADLKEDAFDKTFDCNVKSALFLINSAKPHLEKTKGSVVVVSSFLSQSSVLIAPMYQMAKAAVDHMVRCLALEFGPKGVRVNAINPTLVPGTLVFRDMIPNQADLLPFHELFDRETPLANQKRTPEEQAEVIVFLTSDAARFVSGQFIVVDGALACKGNPLNFMSA